MNISFNDEPTYSYFVVNRSPNLTKQICRTSSCLRKFKHVFYKCLFYENAYSKLSGLFKIYGSMDH